MTYKDVLKATTAFAITAALVAGATTEAKAATNLGSVAVFSGGVNAGGNTLLQAFTVNPGLVGFGSGTGGFNSYSGDQILGAGVPISGGNLVAPGAYGFTSVVGTFSGGSAFTTFATAQTVDIDIFGSWKSSTGLTPTTVPAALILGLTESGGSTGTISFGGTFTTSLPTVPEPVSLSLMGVGLVGLGVARRRKAAKSV